jgi:seryl-tRNA synthetase
MTKEKRRSIQKQWRDLLKLRHKFERGILELMRHPDATAEDLMKAHDAYTAQYKTMREAEYKVETVLRTGSLPPTPDNITPVIKS